MIRGIGGYFCALRKNAFLLNINVAFLLHPRLDSSNEATLFIFCESQRLKNAW